MHPFEHDIQGNPLHPEHESHTSAHAAPHHIEAAVAHETTTQAEPKAPQIGDDVHYVLPNDRRCRHVGEHRPAKIVKIWSPTCVQLQVFTDGTNDYPSEDIASQGLMWRTSIMRDERNKGQGTWHYPEKD